ncbi:LuxR C-terminal-related transcriptional regulator [Thiomicrorhabdus cannonii]|uniref:LuxR C-terminal-related transcriptional regulator n=1 Tax=Thiomicrorhabdus cannonii TaxID=2748011 RepID=UPI001FE57465|nr:response regulator transcription factor [Thiomicrorhabdus cannonii]
MNPIVIFENHPPVIDHWFKGCDSPPIVVETPHQLSSLSHLTPGVLLMQYPQKASHSLIQDFAEKGYQVVVFSPSPSDDEAITAYQHGAKGYLDTFSHPDQIQQAIQTVKMGGVWLEKQHMHAMMNILFDESPPPLEWQTRLTERENDVVRALLDGKSNKEIAMDMAITERTVKAHLQNIFQKMGVKDRLELVLAIHQTGQ